MKDQFTKGLILTSLGSFLWGFVGVLYFKYISFIGHIEVVVHRCLWTTFALIITTFYFNKWNVFLKIISNFKFLNASNLTSSLLFHDYFFLTSSCGHCLLYFYPAVE